MATTWLGSAWLPLRLEMAVIVKSNLAGLAAPRCGCHMACDMTVLSVMWHVKCCWCDWLSHGFPSFLMHFPSRRLRCALGRRECCVLWAKFQVIIFWSELAWKFHLHSLPLSWEVRRQMVTLSLPWPRWTPQHCPVSRFVVMAFWLRVKYVMTATRTTGQSLDSHWPAVAATVWWGVCWWMHCVLSGGTVLRYAKWQ